MRRAVFTGLWIFLSLYGEGQYKANVFNGALIKGVIENGKVGDTLSLEVFAMDYSDNIVFNGDGNTPGVSRFEATVEDGGEFHFRLPRFSINRLKMTLNMKAGLDEIAIIPMTPFRNSDSLIIQATQDGHLFSIVVSGKGGAKYNAKFQVMRALHQFEESMERMFLKRVVFTPNEMNEIYYQSTLAGLKELNCFKYRVDEETFQILRLDLLGDAHNWWLDKLLSLYKIYSEDEKAKILPVLKRIASRASHVDPVIADLSISYLAFLYNLTKVQFRFQNPSFDYAPAGVKINRLYSQFIIDYRGQLRENLIFLLLQPNPEMYLSIYDSTTIPIWQMAYDLFTNPVLKAYAGKRIHFIQKGSDAYPFIFPDSSGQIVRLEQFRGKTILIDVWFTGCRGCLAYAEWLKTEIYPVFEGDTSIIFLSISGDINRKTWLSSVRSGRYTRPQNVNVFTGGLGFTDPFMKYYDFQGGPYALLIDKNGKLYSANLPKYFANRFIPILRTAMQ